MGAASTRNPMSPGSRNAAAIRRDGASRSSNRPGSAAKLYRGAEDGEWSDVGPTGKDAVIDLAAIDIWLPLAALSERLELMG